MADEPESAEVEVPIISNPAASQPSFPAGGVVLIVDDEEQVRVVAARMLEQREEVLEPHGRQDPKPRVVLESEDRLEDHVRPRIVVGIQHHKVSSGPCERRDERRDPLPQGH